MDAKMPQQFYCLSDLGQFQNKHSTLNQLYMIHATSEKSSPQKPAKKLESVVAKKRDTLWRSSIG
jgi:hypothetical protein